MPGESYRRLPCNAKGLSQAFGVVLVLRILNANYAFAYDLSLTVLR